MTNHNSKIEWTDTTWSPVTGCTKVSPGCDNCYAENIARRFAGSTAFPNGFELTLHPERLDAPLRWRKPRRVFVNSMSDLFHQDVPDSFILRVWEVMARTPQHTYQILTKRHARMRSFVRRLAFATPTGEQRRAGITGRVPYLFGSAEDNWNQGAVAPLDNVWLGVSAEDQKRADLRIPALLDTPAHTRFVSAEPLLGEIQMRYPDWQALDWVIVGGESGPGARPMRLSWAKTLVSSCRFMGIAPFVKQLGSAHGPHKGGDMATWPAELQVREFPTAVMT
jgi:protein gp37